MITRIDYYLPKLNGGADFFRQLQVILAPLAYCAIQPNEIGLAHPALTMSTWFHIHDDIEAARVMYMDDRGDFIASTDLPIFTDVPQNRTLDDNANLISEAICSANPNGIDHTGLILAPTSHRQELWTQLVTPLLDHTQLYDYPHDAPEYDADTMRWLFLMPEIARGSPDYNGPLQPKFELVCDADAPPVTVMQIDIQTDYTSDQLKTMLPHSTTIPGLEAAFRSMSFSTPWASLPIMRLDFRAKDPNTDWVTGKWVRGSSAPLTRNCRQLKAPMPQG